MKSTPFARKTPNLRDHSTNHTYHPSRFPQFQSHSLLPNRPPVGTAHVPLPLPEALVLRHPPVARAVRLRPVHQPLPVPAHPPLADARERRPRATVALRPARVARRVVGVAHDELPDPVDAVVQVPRPDAERLPGLGLDQGAAEVLLFSGGSVNQSVSRWS